MLFWIVVKETIILLKAGADAAKNLTVAKQTMGFKDVAEEQSMFLRRGSHSKVFLHFF